LVDGRLEINEEEAPAIRTIFDQYVNTNIGTTGLAKYLENHGIHKIQRQNGKNPLFASSTIQKILKNPVYCGKIAFGRRRTEKVKGTRNEYKLVEQESYLLVDGLHEGLVSEEIWQAAHCPKVRTCGKAQGRPCASAVQHCEVPGMRGWNVWKQEHQETPGWDEIQRLLLLWL
jgi:site-specific DNA recombinase